MLNRVFKNYQLFISHKNKASNLERFYPVISLKKGMNKDVELDLYNLQIVSRKSPKVDTKVRLGDNIYNIKYGEMLPVDTEYGILTLRIINDWTFSANFNFTKFFYFSVIAHLLIIASLAIPKLLTKENDNFKENKKIEERVTALLEKIEEKKPKKDKIELPKKEKKEVKKIVVQKKEKKKGFWPTKDKKKKSHKKKRVSRSSYKNTSKKVTKTTNGGGGKVTSKNVAKSLDFLGGSNNSGKVAVNTKSNGKSKGVRGFGTNGIPVKGISSDNSALKGGSNYSGPINTSGVRNVKSAKYKGSGSGGGTGYAKTLNNVQGKVSAKTLGGSNKGGKVGGSLRRAGSLRISGKGRISQKDIQKAINKKLYRLTYCYEKALLSKPNLSGVIKIQWTITSRRKVKKIKIVKSQMRDKKLHKCLMKEIKKIKFPRPKGGDATVIYPFKFKPTL